ncbi:MAG: hypothetical protein H7Y20_13400 [Bryobacteraceae bacterium]|nr:hypothetical protein [Bryobacteraceae bacterium]
MNIRHQFASDDFYRTMEAFTAVSFLFYVAVTVYMILNNWRQMRVLTRLLEAATFSARAGVTISFEGEAKDNQAVDSVIAEATAFAATRSWRVELVSKDNAELDRFKDEKWVKYVGPVRGVILHPHDVRELIRLEFGSDHALQSFVTTHRAGPDLHVAVVELLNRFKPHFTRLQVEDKGEYWETGERLKLEQHINTVNGMLEDILRGKLSARNLEASESLPRMT